MPCRGARRGRGCAPRPAAGGPAHRGDHARAILFHRPGPRARQAHRDRSPEWLRGAQGRRARRSHPGQPDAPRAGEAPRKTRFVARMKASFFASFGGPEVLARKPASLTHAQCASIGLAGLTALVSIEDTLKLKAGETILIYGGAGGVGGFALALARFFGARVVTTASSANHGYVRALGAHEAIDYRTQDFTQLVSGCDAVFDTVGGDVTLKSFAVLRPGGRLATIASGASAPASPRSDAASLRPKVNRDRPHLDRVAALVMQGVVRLSANVAYPLAEALSRDRVSELRHLRGKLVLRVR